MSMNDEEERYNRRVAAYKVEVDTARVRGAALTEFLKQFKEAPKKRNRRKGTFEAWKEFYSTVEKLHAELAKKGIVLEGVKKPW
jgi:uncharacterized Fe-S cluster-containing radical SAM superfamily enzyme